MANYPQELAQNAAYKSHTIRLTEVWSMPKPAQWLSTYNNILIFFLLLGFPTCLFSQVSHLSYASLGSTSLIFSSLQELYKI